MICWWLANLSFWGAAGALGVVAAVQLLGKARRPGHSRFAHLPPHAGLPVR